MSFLAGATPPAPPPPPPAPPIYGSSAVQTAGSQARAAAAVQNGLGFGGTEKSGNASIGGGAAKPATAVKELLGA